MYNFTKNVKKKFIEKISSKSYLKREYRYNGNTECIVFNGNVNFVTADKQ